MRIGIGNTIPLYKNLNSLSDEALAWKARIEANGGTIPAATLAIFDKEFFVPAKANGNILTELDRLNVYCGLNGFEIAARTNLIKSAHFVTPVSSPTFNNNGYASSGTSYLNLNYNAFSQGVKYTLNSASYFYGIKNPTYSAQRRAMGAANAAVTQRNDIQRNNVGNDAFINSGTSISDTQKPTGNVFVCVKRNLNVESLIVNSITTTRTNAATAIPNLDVYELCLNLNNVATSPFDTLPHTYSGHGSNNLDHATIRTLLNNLLTALGV